jgi:hypothetical protein
VGAVGHGRHVQILYDAPCFGTPVRVRWRTPSRSERGQPLVVARGELAMFRRAEDRDAIIIPGGALRQGGNREEPS